MRRRAFEAARNLTIENFLTEKSFAPKPEMTFDFDDIPNSLRRLVLEKRNILISGATGSGKTNLLNVLLKHVPETDRFLTMEDVRELDTSHLSNTVHFVLPDDGNCRSDKTSCSGNSINQNDVIDAMMRLRPDRIACGELRSRNTIGNKHQKAYCGAVGYMQMLFIGALLWGACGIIIGAPSQILNAGNVAPSSRPELYRNSSLPSAVYGKSGYGEVVFKQRKKR